MCIRDSHLLETVFELVDLCDRVHLARRGDGAIVRRDPLPLSLIHISEPTRPY